MKLSDEVMAIQEEIYKCKREIDYYKLKLNREGFDSSYQCVIRELEEELEDLNFRLERQLQYMIKKNMKDGEYIDNSKIWKARKCFM